MTTMSSLLPSRPSRWTARSIEGGDAHIEPGIFPYNLVRVLVSVEAVHQDQRDVGAVLLVKELDLLDGEVEEGQVVPHRDDGLGATAAHAGAQAAIELDDHQLVQHPLDGGRVLGPGEVAVRSYRIGWK